jgi:hypothetical protein
MMILGFLGLAMMTYRRRRQTGEGGLRQQTLSNLGGGLRRSRNAPRLAQEKALRGNIQLPTMMAPCA